MINDYQILLDRRCDFPCLYQVIRDRIILGSYYQKQGKWLAKPFVPWVPEQSFNSNEKAINYIISNQGLENE